MFFKNRVYLLHDSHLTSSIVSSIHNQGHEGNQKKIKPVAADIHWKRMKQDVQNFVKPCNICQHRKTEHLYPAGVLQPLPASTQISSDISMDFISVLFMVINRLSKYALFILISHPYKL